jgi:tRNA (guanine37-N1)-methyltransferase
MDVPEVLLSGDHGKIAAFRREQSLRKTARVRPDLLAASSLSPLERSIVDDELKRAGSPKEGNAE